MIANITDWLDEIAEKYPDKIAFSDENSSATFSQVRRQAISIAAAISNVGLNKKPIVIFMEKSVDMIISFLAVAYSGNFYTPIDITMPNSRIYKITEVLNPALIVTKNNLKDKIISWGENIPKIIYENVQPCESEKKIIEQKHFGCDSDLLYVLFTSGSTGIPKGVAISHQSVIDYIEQIERIFKFDETIVLGNQAPFYFDNSILDIYVTVKSGATMHIIPEKLFAWPIKLLQFVDEKNINTIFWVPSMLVLVSKLRALQKVKLNGKLRNILFCGEVMPVKHLNEWIKYIPDAVYANLYGPTEIADACTYYIVDRKFNDEETLPIGRSFPNTEIIVLNDKNELVKEDEIGELCVRGTSLSKGYYNNLEKTKEVFVQNPLNENYQETIYRSGDLVKYNEKKELLYIGRKDFQIKHMGHRIELGEIESAVYSMSEISLNCCLYDEKEQKIVLFLEQQISLEHVRAYLKTQIPEYMLPGKVISVNKIPLNSNGKIDRIKLKEKYL